MALAYVVLTLHFTIFQITTAQHHHHQLKSISLGSSLSPSRQPNSWHSFSGRFEFGFYKQGSGFSLGIWLVTSPNITIVWTANRDEPPVSLEATLKLTTGGKLILSSEESEDKVIADPPEVASSASMLDSGNFVLYNKRSVIIWKSFNNPTDTILGGQSLYAGKQLLSSVSEPNSSTQFCLNMQADGNLVLYPKNTKDENTDVYWASNTGNHQQIHLHLDNNGQLLLLTASCQ